MKKAVDAFRSIGKILNVISIAALLVMVCLTIADIFMRAVFKAPITGTVEIVRMMMICMSPAFVGALMEGRHVDVGLVVDRLNRRSQLAFTVFGHGLSAIVCAFMCYQGFVDMAKKYAQHQVYTMLKIPTFPFYFVFAVSMGFFTAAIIVKLLEKFFVKEEEVSA